MLLCCTELYTKISDIEHLIFTPLLDAELANFQSACVALVHPVKLQVAITEGSPDPSVFAIDRGSFVEVKNSEGELID